MSRLTSEWTPTLDEAFGESGTKGRKGEQFLCKVFEGWGWDYIWHEDDKEMQLKGIDISFKKPGWKDFYNCDVKNNMDEYGTFYVHRDWLFKGKSHRIFHVNDVTGWLCWYDRKIMQDWYNRKYEYIKLLANKRPKFVFASLFTGEENGS